MVDKNRKNPFSIKEIKIEKLFGYYDYAVPANKEVDISELLIIYGDNGAGKTTVLKLLFWLLSTKDKSGYKTKIAQTKFKHFSITFYNGIEIGASREGNNYIGTFIYYINQNSKILHSLVLKVTQENAISLQDRSKDGIQYKKILNFIRDLNISVFYLSDDRKILNSIDSSDNESDNYGSIILNDSDLIFSKDYEKVAMRRMLNEKKVSLEPAIDRLFEWVRTKVISGSKTGDKNSQVIYTDLIKNIFVDNKKIQQSKTKEELIQEIKIVESKVAPFVKLGLIEKFDSATIKSSIKKSTTTPQLKSLISILAPYIESINAKLNALEKLKDTLNLFINSINNYFSNKSISFNCKSSGKVTPLYLIS